jgi:hypothetical protein
VLTGLAHRAGRAGSRTSSGSRPCHVPYASWVVAHGWNIDEESPLLRGLASTPAPRAPSGVHLLRGVGAGWNAGLVGGRLAKHTVGS